MTAILRIEHPVTSFERWREAFESQAERRDTGGVRSYRIMRSVDDANYVLIDLELDDRDQAENFLVGLRKMWGGVDVMRDPQTRVVELFDQR